MLVKFEFRSRDSKIDITLSLTQRCIAAVHLVHQRPYSRSSFIMSFSSVTNNSLFYVEFIS